MTHTLAAVFETRAEATKAQEELILNGFDGGSIQITDSGSAAGRARIDDDASILGNIKQMFSELIGREHADRHVYAEALNRGHTVLTIETEDMAKADLAADIVEDFNPIDIDEHETMWRASGWTGAEILRSGTGMQQTTVGALQSAPEPHGIRPREEAVEFVRSEQGQLTQGSLQRGEVISPDGPFAGDPLAEGQRTVQRSGMRIYPRDAEGPNQDSLNILRGDRTDDGDEYFRSHWEKTYTGGTYQEYNPAYLYGESMAGSPAYQQKPWEHAEPELRTTWENTYPQSSWEKFKDAVRAGWERVTR
ncbi:hypothetical protein JOD97_004133 [Duganella sp. 1411]|uniref:hypothetical protein n=1 Tax=Duganella sp. 1411 TaxID=2806572 RepID=UPI001AE4768D|nr:hypothetical protein [Duganella sp. 1411]MBP1206071.1 hypothetical protein [Duganella sp. 1411]